VVEKARFLTYRFDAIRELPTGQLGDAGRGPGNARPAYGRPAAGALYISARIQPRPAARLPKAPADPNRVPAAVQRLRRLYDRALDPWVTPGSVDAAIGSVEGFNKVELDQVVAGCGFRQKFRTKPAVLNALQKWILDRKGAFVRAGV
jgi:hypothetical protein